MSQRSPKRPRRASLPGAFAGFVAGAVLAGALVPLVGAEREVTAAASGAPGFLSDATGQAQGEGPGGPASVIPGAAAGVPSAADAPAPSAISSGGAGPAAPGVQGPSNTDAGAAGPSGSGNRSTDVGVTATTIKIGVLSANCRACDSIGFLATKNAGRMAQAFAADLNRRGGVHGRKLEVVVAEYDPVSACS